MRPTRFSGPVLYSGNPRVSAASLENLPIGFNPDYAVYFDEFQGIPGNVPPNYNFDALASGTFTYAEGNSLQDGADKLYGWCQLSSDETDPSQNNSGGTVMTQESLQFRGRELFIEGRVAIPSPATCEFFFGFSIDGDYTSGFNSDRLTGFELVGGTNSLRLRSRAGGGANAESIVEDIFTYPNGSTTTAAYVLDSVNLAPVLGIRVHGFNASTYADFYVNRRHVGTIRNTSTTTSLGTSIKGIATYFKKTSEISGLTIGTALDAGVASSTNVIINGSSWVDEVGQRTTQIYTDQVLTIGAEDVRVSRILRSDDGDLLVDLVRAENSTTAVAHAEDASISAASQACHIDYLTSYFSRYPGTAAFDDYLVAPQR
jgi:hypothetical protein